ncbi:ribonuclease HII [Neobacillus sp. SM06]|uniref:ribonuclease HII n=1 Tax=Neobacillus sp. SM06 TaxID=3422492 RepID=UPI003D2891CC
MKWTIAQVEKELTAIKDPNHSFFAEIEKDERKGVQLLVTRWKKEWQKQQHLQAKFIEMKRYETKCRAEGFRSIAGVDEVGRGPLAGPVVAAAVILPENFSLPGIDDSKKLFEQKREEYAAIIRKQAEAVSVSFIEPAVIDAINIYQATKKAMASAIASLATQPDFLLIDAMKLDTPYPSESIVKGDAKSISIAAASIIAKVARDHYMKQLSRQYPEYGFEQNMGYGTKEHLQAINLFGITPEHRKSFAPIKEMYIKV